MRTEYDALGERQLDESLYYGIQTLRAKENFNISGKTIADVPNFIQSIVQIKKAAAIANNKVGALSDTFCDAICQAADRIVENFKPDAYLVDIYHGGGGTSANMNVNEVLASMANEIMSGAKDGGGIHPNTHVNMGQSTNDVIPAAMKMTVYHALGGLEQVLVDFIRSLSAKEKEFQKVVKIARTCLQDALPITLGQQFSGYRSAFERMVTEVRFVRKICLELPMSATAIGTEFGTFPRYKEHLFQQLEIVSGLAVVPEKNLFDALQNTDFWVKTSAVVKNVGLNLNKLAGDLRLMSSGPRAGLGEIRLPAVQPGSSIMPGKVNPVMPEMAMQVYFRVLGNDVAITRACEGELNLNVWESLILNCITESCNLLSRCLPLLAAKCIDGIQVHEEKCRQDAQSSLALSTVLATLFDYQAASRIAKQADQEGKTIKEVVIESGMMTVDEADLYLDPITLTSAEHFNKLFKSHKRDASTALSNTDRRTNPIT
ncbi:MAG: aspartate ammonia-lyase [Proteobacteria bacterium]|nr:MAG: aspartate ammonia-lyase [Pseudomonadota bacterium]PIE68176.1 MAG: aspartate ammonia-lyase [Deltaproteobacteria bacterium]